MPKLMYDDKNYSGNASSSGGGMFPHLIVISETGSTVTASKGSTVITARETSTDHFECDLVTPNPQDTYGTWLIHAILNGDDAQANLVVDTVKVYTVDDEHFHADIIVTYPDGSVVSCTKDELSPMYATSSPYTFTVHSIGMYTISGERDGITEIVEVDIISNGQTENVTLELLPDGKTITPTDNIQILLHCAGIDNKSYTTISELLADDTTLLKVLTHNNAIDYLVRSTTYASSVTADSDAMAMIGSYDYASDTLLADSTWASAIIGSTYKSSVVNVEVPTMTSNTAPSGVCSADSVYNNYYAFYAFDKNTSQGYCWISNHSVANNAEASGWVEYEFTKKVKIYGITCLCESISPMTAYMISGTDDDVTIEDFATGASFTEEFISNPNAHLKWRLALTSKNTSGSTNCHPRVNELQFYGRENGGVQSWLRAGGITDKSYTTLAEVLADTTTLSALIASHDAVDYLVTAKGLIDGIVADATAMSYIGLNNYCANTLLADAEWCTAIIGSTYVDSVCNVKIPTMTSNTTPSGVASASGNASGYEAYKAFDADASSSRWVVNSVTSGWLRYQFTSAVTIKGFVLKPAAVASASNVLKDYTIQGSDNGTNWTTLYTGINTTLENVIIDCINNSNSYSYYRLNVTSITTTGNNGFGVYKLQFYGRVDV